MRKSIFAAVPFAVLALAAPAAAKGGHATTYKAKMVAAAEATETAERAELEAARDAKYREIRDAELDHRTGKLSDADWRAQDRALRAEAVDILRRLDELGYSREGASEDV